MQLPPRKLHNLHTHGRTGTFLCTPEVTATSEHVLFNAGTSPRGLGGSGLCQAKCNMDVARTFWPCTLMLGRSPPPACSALAAQSLLADCRPPSMAYLNQAVQSMSLYTDSQKGACTSAIGARIYSCRSAVCTVVDSLTSLSNDSRVVLVCPESVEPASPNSLPAHCCDLGHASCDAKQSRSDTTKHRSPIYSTRTLSHTLVNPC